MDVHPSVFEALGHYVYAYVDPADESIRYIGKGVGTRALAHLDDERDSPKTRWIASLLNQGRSPRIDILARNLSERQAFNIERVLIDAIGIGPNRLTNKVRGHGAATGREPLLDLATTLNPLPLEAHHELLIVRLNKHFRPGLTTVQLYDLARGVWSVGERRNEVEVVLAMAGGIVRGAFVPTSWHPAGTTPYVHEPRDDVGDPGLAHRWEFIGTPAPDAIWNTYVGRDASSVFKRGNVNSFGYVSPKRHEQ